MSGPPSRRSDLVQGPPDPDLDLKGFPTDALTPEAVIYRAHAAGYGPWWYDNTPGDSGGRFNLTDADQGTCYVADTPEAALRERFGKTLARLRWIDAETASRAELSLLTVSRERTAGNVSTPEAAGYGITSELTDAVPYDISQEWAALFDGEGFDGIHYTARFSAGGAANAWALFGPYGEHPEGEDPATVPGIEACRSVGIEVREPAPHPDDVTIIRPDPLPDPATDT
ncbi:RES domain-containing protein [Leifsonia sp. fls2-241-R2A-40a]|uniref:RES domain-containing protein n=1 Tax=Leifsonia sp. fls2-241-R2A-40a TaxID=3040290 RepID=UPI002549E26D|nr:RES domain-containing protein [Leifsonia sp. fls2-241-R2A-40a]